MTSVRSYAVAVALVVVGVAGAMAVRLLPPIIQWRKSGGPGRAPAVIRRPNPRPIANRDDVGRHGALVNIAPLATVTVSSREESRGESDAGVADGALDTQEWVAAEGSQGAWIKLSWDRPVTIAEMELYDRRSLLENVQRGALIFEDGATIPVPALPPDGSPWTVRFAPKTVQWVMFRIDSAQGTSAGLAEIMVYGSVRSQDLGQPLR